MSIAKQKKKKTLIQADCNFNFKAFMSDTMNREPFKLVDDPSLHGLIEISHAWNNWNIEGRHYLFIFFRVYTYTSV